MQAAAASNWCRAGTGVDVGESRRTVPRSPPSWSQNYRRDRRTAVGRKWRRWSETARRSAAVDSGRPPTTTTKGSDVVVAAVRRTRGGRGQRRRARSASIGSAADDGAAITPPAPLAARRQEAIVAGCGPADCCYCRRQRCCWPGHRGCVGGGD